MWISNGIIFPLFLSDNLFLIKLKTPETTYLSSVIFIKLIFIGADELVSNK